MATWWGAVEWLLVLDGDWTRSKVCKLEPLLNKVLSGHTHTHSFMYCLWQFLCYDGRVEYCDSNRTACKV